MNKLLFPLLGLFLFSACQNAAPEQNTSTEAPNTTGLPAVPNISPEQAKNAAAKATALLANMNNLLNEVNAASTAAKGAQKAEFEAMSNQLSDGMAKADAVVKSLNSASSEKKVEQTASFDSPAAASPQELKDNIEAVENYSKFLDDLKGQFEALKSGEAKKN